MKKLRQTTTTTLVLEKLRAMDDLVSARTLVVLTGRSHDRVHAALVHLRRHKAVDYTTDASDGRWWFALPPEDDDRLRVVEEIVPDYRKPRRVRRRQDA